MATMHSLFLGFLSVAFCALGSPGDRAVGKREAVVNHGGAISGFGSTVAHASLSVRERIADIAIGEIGVREATGNNDGERVAQYLAYTGLVKGYAWCAAFVSWCYGQAGAAQPRNAWSPALFPMSRRYTAQAIRQGDVRQADLFAIYSPKLGRIDHTGIVLRMDENWVITVEGNSDDRVLSKRRPRATVYAFSNWLD